MPSAINKAIASVSPSINGIEGEFGRFMVVGRTGEYLVDLLAYRGIGFCGCQDFEFRCAPLIGQMRKLPDNADDYRCKHIKAVRRYAGSLLLDALIIVHTNNLRKAITRGSVPLRK